jgi:hypothetical protein
VVTEAKVGPGGAAARAAEAPPRAEVSRVRDLARRVAEIARSPEQEVVRQRWRDVNALRRPDRAPVWTSGLPPVPEPECADPYLRGVENRLLRLLAAHDLGMDHVVEGTFGVAAELGIDRDRFWGPEVRKVRPEGGGAFRDDPPLKTEADFDLLRSPDFRYDEVATAERVERAAELLGDILPVKVLCPPGPPLLRQLGSTAQELRGQERLLYDVVDSPRLVHRLMGFLRDAVLRGMDQLERLGLLTPYTLLGPTTYSDPIGPPVEAGRLSFANLWIMANNQTLALISPEMWEEFVLRYQLPILARFGLCNYGCCEDNSDRMDRIGKIPNLRTFVCNAWTDLDKAIVNFGRGYVIKWEQKASDVVLPDDTAAVRRHLEEGARKLRGCRYQIVLRSVTTLGGHPRRLHEWVRIAVEAAEKSC